MLAILSPAKKLDFKPLAQPLGYSDPTFPRETLELIKNARKLSRTELKRLMKISDNLADLSHQRFKSFVEIPKPGDAKQAVMAFAGDTYVGLDAAKLNNDDLVYAQDHLRIISGLYGLLRPLDMIQPYRLEMGSRLKTPRGSDLYAFWGDQLTKAIDGVVEKHKSNVVVNVASNEYFKATNAKLIKARIITPVFKEAKDGEIRNLGMRAKRARGQMARYLIKNRIEEPEGLKDFNLDGYTFCDDLSEGDNWIFVRDQLKVIQ